MKTYICKNCGAPVHYEASLHYGICDYCGSSLIDDEISLSTSLDGEIQHILSARPYAWEHKLIFAVIASGIHKAHGLKTELFSPIPFSGNVSERDLLPYIKWMNQKLQKLPECTASLNRIFSCDLQKALGLPGLPGDAAGLVRASNDITSVYAQILYWGLEFRTTNMPGNLSGLAGASINMAKSLLEDIEYFCYVGRKSFTGLQPGMEVPQSVTLVLRPVKMNIFMDELHKLGFS